MPAMVTSVEAVRVEHGILLDYFTSQVVLAGPEIGSSDQNIAIDVNWKAEKLHFILPGCIGEYEGEGDESDDHDTIPTASR
jgi:hypothetical protein